MRILVLFCVALGALLAQPGPELLARIREESAAHSKVKDYATQLIDGIGPRLTGSPNLAKAVEWARKTATVVGLEDVRTESWGEFGLGWEERNVSLSLVQPFASPLIARAAPWSPPTDKDGVNAQVVAVKGFRSENDFEAYRGKLRGKIVLFGTAPSAPVVRPIVKPLFQRLSQQQLDGFASQPIPPHQESNHSSFLNHASLMEKAGRFFSAEKVAAVLVPSGNNDMGGASGGTIYADTNYTFGWFVYQAKHAMPVPLAILATEHYGQLNRLLERNVPVSVKLNVDTKFSPGVQQGFNVFAEIPGLDPQRKQELVLVTAHLDSWSAGNGATDDGAGVIIAMEAMRLLKATGAKPLRTIRLALWTGEEQGALGSREYVKRHVADVPLRQSDAALPEFLRHAEGAITAKSLHPLISAVYTLDAGGGKIRGISTGNPALVELFRQWLEPLRDLGAGMVWGGSDCGGDCASFAQAGIPTPSFKQDPLDYDTKTHHTNMDTLEHLIPEDLQQASIIVASLLYNTAMHPEMLPRVQR